FHADDGNRDGTPSRGLGDVYKRQALQYIFLRVFMDNSFPGAACCFADCRTAVTSEKNITR
ncbi:hypothetical protein, partial [Blautia wexlerae]|uniref:hypothetical protein n=1 Tax=Blautia wexlerae TaxID=418240 RepID=UPI00321BB9D8